MRQLTSILVLLACVAPVAQSQQQSTVFVGHVADSTRRPIAGAEIALPGLSKSAVTNDSGRFQISGISAGRHEVIVRHLGYAPYVDHIAFAANQTIEREILLRRVTRLDTVSVSASVVIPSFEEHRRLGIGHFITRAELAALDGHRLSNIIAQVQGVRIRNGANGRAWLYSSRRGQTSIMPSGTNRGKIDAVDAKHGAMSGVCYAHVYLDNSIVYRGSPEEPLFDINSLTPSQIEAIEYYSGPARTPLKYSRLNSECGVLVIHTRKSL